MSEYLVFDRDGSYYALAQNEKLRDIYLREIMVQNHAEGYAEPMPEPDPEEVKRSVDAFKAAYERAIRSQQSAGEEAQ